MTPYPKKTTISTPIAIIITVAVCFGFCMIITIVLGIIGKLNENKNTNQAVVETTNTNTNSNANVAPPTPSPPPDFATLKKKADSLMILNDTAEYTKDDLKPFDEVRSQLDAIPKTDKNYKAAQDLNKKLIEKSARIAAEVLVLGPKPNETELHVAFNRYLRKVLNDYDSSEYVSYSPAVKVTVKGEPFWLSVLKLRAKNAFGAYIMKDVRMYLRNKEVVAAEDL